MGHRYQKGSSRPDPRAHHDNGRRHAEPRTLQGGIPWPTCGDGTPYILDGTGRGFWVRHKERPKERGKVQWVEWCHPDGTHMAGEKQLYPANAAKGKAGKARPGAWYAIVSWDNRDVHREPEDRLLARIPMENLVATETPENGSPE